MASTLPSVSQPTPCGGRAERASSHQQRQKMMLELILCGLGAIWLWKQAAPLEGVSAGNGSEVGRCGAQPPPPLNPRGRRAAWHSTGPQGSHTQHVSISHPPGFIRCFGFPNPSAHRLESHKTAREGETKRGFLHEEGSVGGEGRDTFSLCYGLEMAISGARASQNPCRPALTWDTCPGPRDQWHGGFAGVNSCWRGVTARLGVPAGQACGWERQREGRSGADNGHTAAQ